MLSLSKHTRSLAPAALNLSATARAHDRGMPRVIALTQAAHRKPIEALRMLIVYGCALALIAARYPLTS
jgi:hypothetical protein